VAVALAAAIAAVVVSGEGDEAGGGIRWQAEPELISPPTLPRDGIVTGRVRNDSLRKLRLEADDLVVVDDRGRKWRTSGRFLSGFAHGLWPPGQEVARGSVSERERLGVIADLDPGEQVPLTVAWRRPRGGGRPVRIQLDRLTLPIPARRGGV
jgi:hypothetical protein